jgi:3-oxoacyl-[acyl-carrier protein] reductase
MNIVVTGATKGIGKAIALLFAKHGFNVAACARTQADLDTLKGELIALHPSATIITRFVTFQKRNRYYNLQQLVNLHLPKSIS